MIADADKPKNRDALHLFPSPADIANRLKALARERALLRRQLKLSLAAHEEQHRRKGGGK